MSFSVQVEYDGPVDIGAHRFQILSDGKSAGSVVLTALTPTEVRSKVVQLLSDLPDLDEVGLEEALGSAVREVDRDGGRGGTRVALSTVGDLPPPDLPGRSTREESLDFVVDDSGRPRKTLGNFRRAVKRLGGTLRFNELALVGELEGVPGCGPRLDDAAIEHLWFTIDEQFGLTVGKDRFWGMINEIARQARYHPVRDYLDSLTWDGVERLDRLFIDYFSAEDTAYVRAVGRLLLTAAVRRVRKPGTKFDELVVLEGAQGTGKSSAIKELAVNEDWFTDAVALNSRPKELLEQTSGKWVVECPELAGLRRAEVESLKAMISRTSDRARLSYGRQTTERPRQFVMVGSTNSSEYLLDATGNRRLWPIRTGEVHLEGLIRDRDQLWAEAVRNEASGVSIRLPKALWVAAAVEQSDRELEDPFVGMLAETFAAREGRVLKRDVWTVLGIPPQHRSTDVARRVSESMRKLGWESTRRRHGGHPAQMFQCGAGEPLLAARVDQQGNYLGEVA